MPGKVIDAITILGAASVGSTLDVATNVTTPAIKITSGATAGKYLQSDADGNATWQTVNQEWGMRFEHDSVGEATVLDKVGTQAVLVLTAAAEVTLPLIDTDVEGRMYLLVNKHDSANVVTAAGTQTIDGAGAPGTISLPADGGKCLLVAGTSAQGWFTI